MRGSVGEIWAAFTKVSVANFKNLGSKSERRMRARARDL